MGDIIPKMGAGTGLGNALFTRTQQRVLAILFGAPHRSFYLNEIVRLSRAGNGAVHRELGKLLACGLVTAGLVGNQKHYQANASAPIFEELRGIVLKTFGLVDVLRARLESLASQIDVAFVYGSVAKGMDRAGSDIDIMMVSETVSYPDALVALDVMANPLGREVNPRIYRRVEFERRASEESGFLSRVLEGPKLFLIGSEGDIPKPRKARTRR